MVFFSYQTKRESPAGDQFWKFSRQCSIFGRIGEQWVAISSPAEIDSNFTARLKHRITRHYSAKLQMTKQTLTTSKHSIEFTYSDFPCHPKVNRDKLALTNHRWTCKKGKRLTITANF